MATPQVILVVAAHPDDELLGCGGTLARHARAGDAVHILILATGAASRGKDGVDGQISELEKNARSAAEIIGARPPLFGGFPDNAMDSVELLAVVKRIEAVIADIQPDVVYTHHGGDLNIDHRIAHEAVMTACRPLPEAPVRAIYAFETSSSTEWASAESQPGFRPTRFTDISETLEVKLSALACYETEMRDFPHPRSNEAITSLAKVRGAAAGLKAAEAFTVLRQID
jgi:LmbE family N-acetylglucosaminyl deacetylase